MENTNEIKADSLQVSGIEEAFEKLREILGRMKLIRYCNETIDTVEKKVRVLSAEGETDAF